MTILTTPRLRLEPFDDAHLEGLFRMNSDPDVMRYITGKPETREQTRAVIERVKGKWAEVGFSWWSLIEIASGDIIGAGGVQHLGRDNTNPLEVGWRLRKDKWHQGFASEAARCMAAFAFDTLDAASLHAVCDPENIASARVMQRLGMTYRGIERWYDMNCWTFVITRAEWEGQQQGDAS